MVRTPCYHCQGPGVLSLVGELRSCKPHSSTKKKKKNKMRILENLKPYVACVICLLDGAALEHCLPKSRVSKIFTKGGGRCDELGDWG